MIRNLGVLVLAAAAVFATNALTATAASAQTTGKLTVDSGTSATLDMTEIEGKTNALTTSFSETKCPGSTVTGHQLEHEQSAVPAGASSFTVTPHFVNCKWEIANIKTTVTMHGCDFEFNIGETVSENHYSLTADTTCLSFEEHIQWERYAFPNTELGGVQCTFTFKSENGLTGLTLTTDTVNDDLKIEGQLGMQYEESGSAPGCTGIGVLQWDINMTVKGTKSNGEETGITVTH